MSDRAVGNSLGALQRLERVIGPLGAMLISVIAVFGLANAGGVRFGRYSAPEWYHFLSDNDGRFRGADDVISTAV